MTIQRVTLRRMTLAIEAAKAAGLSPMVVTISPEGGITVTAARPEDRDRLEASREARRQACRKHPRHRRTHQT